MLEAALQYAKKGYRVIPCDSGKDKGPLTEHGKNDASSDEAQIRTWWTRWPSASIGLPMKSNGLYCLDIDRHKDKPDGLRAWDTVCFKNEIPKRTAVMAITGGETSGQHNVYQHPGAEYTSLRADPKNSIDPRDDQYILVEPSRRTDTGKSYKWIKGHSILEAEPAPMHPNLLKWLTRKLSGPGGDASDPTVVLLIEEGWAVDSIVEPNVRLRGPGWPDGHQATWNGKVFYIFSTTEAPPFESEGRYNAAQVKELLRGSDTEWFKQEAERLYQEAAHNPETRKEHLDQLAKLLARAGPLQQEEFAHRLSGVNICPKTAFKQQIKFYLRKQKIQDKADAKDDRIRGVTTKGYSKLFDEYGFKLRLNECNDDEELNGIYCGDIAMAKVTSTIADWAIENPDRRINYRHLEDAITVVAAENTYHPVKEYLQALTWDGEDHIAKLAAYVVGTHFEKWFKHWSAATIAKVYKQEQSPMLVFCGPPDIGKSTLVEWLAAETGLFLCQPLKPNEHDCRMRMWTTWIWEVAELGATTKKTVQEALKWILTLGVLRERKSYGHRDTIKPVTASFIGTVNPDAGFLTDRTGNRRYLVTEIEEIKWAYKDEVKVDQVWAQAKAIYDSGEWRLSKEDKELRDEENLKHMGPSVIGELLSKLYEQVNDTEKFVWTSDVLDDLSSVGYKGAQQNWALKEVISIFRALGCTVLTDKTVDGRRGTAILGVVRTKDHLRWNIGETNEEEEQNAN